MFIGLSTAITNALFGGAFSPLSLFGASDQGIAIDFTTSTNIKQDSAGSTAVTTYGEPIGMGVDISGKGNNATQTAAGNRAYWSGMPRTLGTELVSNGRFDTDTVWTKGTGWTIAAGVATKAAGVASVLSQSVTLTAEKIYFLHYSATRSAGTVAVRFTGGTSVFGTARSANGSYVEVVKALSGNTTIELSADASFAGTVDNVTVKEVLTFTNGMAFFDGANDKLVSAAVNMSGSDKATLIISSYYGQNTATRVPIEYGNYLSSVAGSFMAQYDSRPNGFLRGSTGSAGNSTTSASYGAPNTIPMANVEVFEFDLSQATIATEVVVTTSGIKPAMTQAGTTAGSGNMAAAGAFSIGSATNDIRYWRDGIHRIFAINRILTAGELVSAVSWVKRGMAYCAILGDSTVAVNNSGVGLPNAYNVSAMTAGIVSGGFDVSTSGDKIADQKTKWTAIVDKTALQAVIVQIGLNDVRSRVGSNTATTATVIADYQDLIDTINAAKPSGCKVYVSQMTPCKGWLDGATNPTAAYSAWQDLNTAIAGGGASPITGVGGRITSHVALLNDGSGNLLDIYNHNADGVHESNEARFIIAQAWRTQLEADGLV